MSTLAIAAGDGARASPTSLRARDSLALRALSFFALMSFAAIDYATLIVHPPAGRVIAAVAFSSLCGAALARSSALAWPGWWLALARLLAVALTLVLSLTVIGVPLHLLAPAGWGRLGYEVDRAVNGLSASGWRWPYRGDERWSRLVVLMVLAPWLTAASSVCFWPSRRRAGARRMLALAMGLTIMLAGVANAPAGAWRVQGALLTLALFAWLWLPTVAGLDATRAGAWLLACTIPALVAAEALRGGAWLAFDTVQREPAAVTFAWDQLYGPIAWPHGAETVLTVTGAAPTLVRVTSLDRFDGLRFLRSDEPPATAALEARLAIRGPARRQRERVTVGALRSTLLAGLPGVTTAVRWTSGTPPELIREADGTIGLTSAPPPDARYETVGYVPDPSIARMEDAPRTLPAAFMPYVQFELPGSAASALSRPNLSADARARLPRSRLVNGLAALAPAGSAERTAVEASPYGPMLALARRLARGQRSSYDVAARIESYLRSGYTYDEHPPLRRYPLEAFLFEDRRGYCEQFSGAMTLMLRMDGIPARVGVGFKPTVYDPARGGWIVRPADAHAWVEVFFSGIGWVSFDPTPAAARAGSQARSKAALLRGRSHGGAAHGTPARARAGHRGAGGAGATALWLALVGVSLALVVIAAALARWSGAGARRLRDAISGDGEPAVAEVSRALSAAGWATPPSLTLSELAGRLERAGSPGAAGYARSLCQLRYAGADAARAGGEAPTGAGRGALRRALAAGHGPSGWLRMMLAIPPGWVRGGRVPRRAGARVAGRAAGRPPS
jgi:transglutaminase-like putative cysteine protease